MVVKDLNGNTHSNKSLRGRVTYWLLLDESIVTHTKNSVIYSSMVVADSLKQAWKMAGKYNPYLIQRMVKTPWGNFCVKEWVRK